jgi:hypothetical protein
LAHTLPAAADNDSDKMIGNYSFSGTGNSR